MIFGILGKYSARQFLTLGEVCLLIGRLCFGFHFLMFGVGLRRSDGCTAEKNKDPIVTKHESLRQVAGQRNGTAVT